VLALPWLAYISLGDDAGYVRQSVGSTGGYNVSLTSPANVAQVVLGNLTQGADVLWVVAPLLTDLSPVGVALFVYVAWQSARTWWRGGEAVHLHVLLYLLLLLVWPWRVPGRFLWPLAPLLAWYLLAGLRDAWTWTGAALARGSARRSRLPSPVAPLLALTLLVNGVGLAVAGGRMATTGWVGEPTAHETYLAMLETVDYVRGLESGAVLGTNHWSTTSWWHLYTRRQGVDGLAREDGLEPFFVRRTRQGDPEQVTHFIYQADNGRPTGATDDLPTVRAALTARGASTEPAYCAREREVCVFDWRRQEGSPAPPDG
jgi:hypothetical protein